MDNIYHQDLARTTSPELDEMTQFIRSVYYYALGIMLTTVGLWLVVLALKVHPYRYLPFPAYMLVIVIFFVMVSLNCVPRLATCSPCKWMLVIVVVLCTTIAGCWVLDEVGPLASCAVMLAVAIIILVLNFSGSKCPQEFLPGGVFSTMLMLILLVVLIVVGIAQLATGNQELLDTFVSIVFIMVVIAILIQAQFNHGRLKTMEVSPKHHKIVCILTLYLHTMMFFLCICYFIRIEDKRKLKISFTTIDSGYYT